MIISFSGRKKSGKSLACSILKDKGYQELNFADPLKQVAYEMAGEYFQIEECYDLEAKERPRIIYIKSSVVLYALNKRGIPNLPKSLQNYGAFEFTSLRKYLQWVGTELFREHDKDYWVNLLVSKVEPNKDYVIGDARFSNEVEALKKLGGVSVMLNRPALGLNQDTHDSEKFEFTTDYLITNTDLVAFKEAIITTEEMIRWLDQETKVAMRHLGAVLDSSDQKTRS